MKRRTARKIGKSIVQWLLIASLAIGLLSPGIGGGQASAAEGQASAKLPDLAGHWAEQTVREWVAEGLIEGYDDGTFRPDQALSRVEFATLVNRLFAFKGISGKRFSDVADGAWYSGQVQAASEAGYIQGYSDGRFLPDKKLSRVDAAVILSRLVPVLAKDGENRLGAFKDEASIPVYGRERLEAVVESGYMGGLADGAFGPLKPMTRAEAVAMLDRVLKQSARTADGLDVGARTLTTGGAWGPAQGSFEVAGDLLIEAPGTTLRNVTVKGNLTIGKAVGEGDVFLQGVTVLGSTAVNGGGKNSVHIDDSKLGTVVVDKVDGRVRVVVGGTTVIQRMEVQSEANIEAPGTEDSGIEGITISSSGEVTLSGSFAQVEVRSDVKLTVASGAVAKLTVGEQATSPTITLQDGVNVVEMELHAAAEVKGEGTIGKAVVDSPGVVFEKEPGTKEVTDKGGASTGIPGGGGGPSIPSGPSGPTGPTDPTGPADTTVSVTAEQPVPTGFLLRFSSPVPGLSASNLQLKDSANAAVSVTSATTVNGGSSYFVAAALTEGAVYTLSIAKSGYRFGQAITVSVPNAPIPDVSVTTSVYVGGQAGFTLYLTPPVAGLSASSFTLKNGANAVGIGAVTEQANGSSYAFDAALSEGETYSLKIAQAGYDFGQAVSVYVPVTDPTVIDVNAEAFDPSVGGFSVSFNPAVAGITADDLTLTSDRTGAAVAATAFASDDDGATYVAEAVLEAGETYTLDIDKAGYDFGPALAVAVPAAGDIPVGATVRRISTAGFVLQLDRTVPELDALSFGLKDEGGADIGIDMLSAVSVGTEYEVYSSLVKGETYSLTLDKEGYAFNEAVVLTVEPSLIPSGAGWTTRQGFKLVFPDDTVDFDSSSVSLTGPDGNPVAALSVTTAADGRSAVIAADLTEAGDYAYRVDVDDNRYAAGTISVPETLPVAKYTTFAPSNAGLVVHFAVPVPGLAAEAFLLTNSGTGDPISIDRVTTADGGSSYFLESASMQFQSVALEISSPGYDFGGAASIVRATINRWSPGVGPSTVMVGLNPNITGLAAADFKVTDEAGAAVAITDVTWDSGQRFYVVSYNGLRGKPYTITPVVEGYDFGEPATVTQFPKYGITDVSYAGFTFVLNPPAAIDTDNGFVLRRADRGIVPIRSANVSGDGSSYRIDAALAPGDYELKVSAALDQTTFLVRVPVVATMSVDGITDTGLKVKLNYAVPGLTAGQFALTNNDTGASVMVTDATTSDGGLTYALKAELPGGSYNLKLSGHLPAAGVDFDADDTIDAGLTTIANVTNAGFDLKFDREIPGLLPANVRLTDDQGSELSGFSLTTTNGGLSYRVSVALSSDRAYTVALSKDYVKFADPAPFPVNRFVTGVITGVTKNGAVSVTFSAALAQLEFGPGLAVKDVQGNRYHPGTLSMSADGKSFEMTFRGTYALTRGESYVFDIDLPGYTVSAPAFAVPAETTVEQPSVNGLTVRFDVPVAGLAKKHFVLRTSQGEAVTVKSATTSDSGLSYLLEATLQASKSYTLLVKPDSAYQIYETVPFVLTKQVAASVADVKSTGFKLIFAEKIAGLKTSQIVLKDANGSQFPFAQYALSTKDQGLTYAVTFPGMAGESYSLELNREDFRLPAPLLIAVPAAGVVRVVGATPTKIFVDVSPRLPDMAKANFKLTDARGQPVDFALAYEGGVSYSLTGSFDVSQTYSLVVSYPGFDFGSPLAVGLKIRVDAVLTAKSQLGFKLYLFPAIPDLQSSDIAIKDKNGNPVTIASLTTNDGGASYDVEAPLSGSGPYTITVAKGSYVFSAIEPIALSSRTAKVGQASVSGFELAMNEPTVLLYSEVKLLDDNGASVMIRSFVSKDGGYTYKLGATISPDRTYTVVIAKQDYDFGAPLPLLVKSVRTAFGGMVGGDNQAFLLTFDQPVPDLGIGDFVLKRADGRTMPLIAAATEDGGATYRIDAEFRGSEHYAISPSKAGYDFGAAVIVEVPILSNAAVLSAGISEIVIGVSPFIVDLNAGDVVLTDEAGNGLAANSVVSRDGGRTYAIQAAYTGGQTYSVKLSKAGYAFERELSVELPASIVPGLIAAGGTGLIVSFEPKLDGMSAGNFTLKDSLGNPIAVDDAVTNNGGATYALSAALEGGETYRLTVAEAGYDFGTALTAYVPIAPNPAVTDIGAEGFKVAFDREVPGLTASHFALKDGEGHAVPVDSVATSDGGMSYEARSTLTEGASYSLVLTKNGYDFGGGLPVLVPAPPVPEALPPIALTVGNVTGSGFRLSLSEAVPNLSRDWLTLLDDQGRGIGIGLSNPNANNPNDNGLFFDVFAPLAAGAEYTIEARIPGRDTAGPAGVLLPITVYPNNVVSTRNGLTVTFIGGGPQELLTRDAKIAAEDGSEAIVTGVSAGANTQTYFIAADLADGHTYSVTLSKDKYIFDWQGRSNRAFVPVVASGAFSRVNENGFDLILSTPVPDLTIEMQNDNGLWSRPTSLATPDFGQTYRIGERIGYNKAIKVRLSKSGYDFGDVLTVNNVSGPPALIEAVSSANGKAITLTFDKPLASVTGGSTFSIKINNQWQSGVNTRLTADTTKVELTWSASGATLNSLATAFVAYSGVNRVLAVNQTYLPNFGDFQVVNLATLDGILANYASLNDAATPARMLRADYGKTALEAMKLLRQAGFSISNYSRAVKLEYGMGWNDFAALYFPINADMPSALKALRDSGYLSELTDLIPAFVSSGYEADEIALALRKLGSRSKDVAVKFKSSGVTARDTASALRQSYGESAGAATSTMKTGQYGYAQIRDGIQFAYELTNEETAEAFFAATIPAAAAAAAFKDAYSADAVTAALLLSGAGYKASDIGNALRSSYAFGNAEEAAKAYLGAGFDVQTVYSLTKGLYDGQASVAALLASGAEPADIAVGVKAAGDGAGVVIGAMKAASYGVSDIATAAYAAWGASLADWREAMIGFAANGYDNAARLAVLRESFGADVASAVSVLYPSLGYADQRQAMLASLLRSGYGASEVAAYALKYRIVGQRGDTLNALKQAGLSLGDALDAIRGAALGEGSSFTTQDAVQTFYGSYLRLTAGEALSAIRTVFAKDENASLDAVSLAKLLSDSRMWDKMEIAEPLVAQTGLTLEQWVELEKTNAFSRFACPCSVQTIVKDSQYLFKGTTVQSATAAMSVSASFTLDEIIDGTVGMYPTSGISGSTLPYLMSGLKNAGYPFADVAAAFDARGWSDWIRAFSRQGIAASEVAAYLRSSAGQPTPAQVVAKLAPYPLKDIALVLRTEYGMDTTDASALLTPGNDSEDVARAIAAAYGGEPIALWIQTMKEQGGTAISVINTIGARYRSYWDSGTVGPALMKAGFTKEEVMEGLLVHTRLMGSFQNTIGVLNALYGQEQITVAELLDASSSETPEDGISFLRAGGYAMGIIIRSLKDYYGLASGETSALLSARYPNDVVDILSKVAIVYGEGLEETVAGVLEEKGIATIEDAIPYLRSAGFSLKDIASVAKTRFGLSAGQIALKLWPLYNSTGTLIQTIAEVYGEPVELAMYERQAAEGTDSFAAGIELAYRAQFNLYSIVKMAKIGYGISSGTALQGLLDSQRFTQSESVAAVTNVYGSSPNESVTDSLAARNLTTLGDAVSYLRHMRFSTRDIVRVGKDYYGLDSTQAANALIAAGADEESLILAEIASVYGMELEQVTIQAMIDHQYATFSGAIPELKTTYALYDMVRIAKDYFGRKPGEALSDLTDNGYSAEAVVPTIYEIYGRPTNQSASELIKGKYPTFAGAVPFLRGMGYNARDIAEVAKDYYGLAADKTIDVLVALQTDSAEVVRATVAAVYGQASESTALQLLEAGGIQSAAEAIPYLSDAGVSLADIAGALKDFYGKTAGEAATLLIGGGSFETEAILGSLVAIYPDAANGALVEAVKTAGALSAEDAASLLFRSGFRLQDIASSLKGPYGKSREDALTILQALGGYQASALDAALDKVYGVSLDSTTLIGDVLKLKGVTTDQGAVQFLENAGYPVTDIARYLKLERGLDAGAATELLAPYFAPEDVGLAMTAVYYADTSLLYLKDMFQTVAFVPLNVVNYMKGKFAVRDIVLAMKVLFNLDAADVMETIPEGLLPAEQVRKAIVEVYGDNPILAYLGRMKDDGKDSVAIATEMQRQSLLYLGSDYMVDTMLALEFDRDSIVRAVYFFFTAGRGSAMTVEEEVSLYSKLGYSNPGDIIDALKRIGYVNSDSYAYRVFTIVKTVLPQASMGQIAKDMKSRGYVGKNILNVLEGYGARDDSIAELVRDYGYNAMEAVKFLDDRTLENKLYWMNRLGYPVKEYLKYTYHFSNNTIGILKGMGITAIELAKAFESYNYGNYRIAEALYNGGFTDIKVLAEALLSTSTHVEWIPGDLLDLGHWTLLEIAKAMIDSELITLAQLTKALRMATDNNLGLTYSIVKEVSAKERQAFYDSLDSTERFLLDGNEIASIVAMSTLRGDNVGVYDAARVLQVMESMNYKRAIVMLSLVGYSVGDALSAAWDVYRLEIGIDILKTMIGQTCTKVLTEFKDYYRLGNLVYKIVTKISR